MERRNFLKRLFGIGVGAALASVPAIAKMKEEETFTIDDMFEPCDGNKNLFYLKTDSWLESEIRNELGDRFVNERYFAYYCFAAGIIVFAEGSSPRSSRRFIRSQTAQFI